MTLLDTYQKALANGPVRAELKAWIWISLVALAVAGVFAALLALARVPGVQNVLPWAVGFFHRALVTHVVLSFVVWFLAVMGALFGLAAARLGAGEDRLRLGKTAATLSGIACALLVLPAFREAGEASLNNYVPVIIEPLYYAALALLAAGVGLAALRLTAAAFRRRGPVDGVTLATVGAAVAYLMALSGFAVSAWLLRGESLTPATNELLFWGGGHTLQYANTLLLLGAWMALGWIAFGAPPVGPRIERNAVALLTVFALMTPLVYLAFPIASSEFRSAFTDLQYGLGPSPVLLAVGLLVALAERRVHGGLPWSHPGFLCLILSMGVFGLGGVLGFFIDGADTRTPSHYHAMIGGIALAYMGLFHVLLLPLAGRPVVWGRSLRLQILFYACGQTLQCLGLFLAGGYGTARKVAGASQGLQGIGQKLGMALNGLGALLAIVGGILFIVIVARALWRKPTAI